MSKASSSSATVTEELHDSKSSLPTHIGIILDGNRRWAKEQGLPQMEGHRIGFNNFETISLNLFERGISYVSAYVFSTENWNRSADEVGYLMKLIIKLVETRLDEYQEKGVKIVVMGERDRLPKNVVAAIDRAVAKTATNTKATLALCLNYGGRREIVAAVKRLVMLGAKVEDIDEAAIAAQLYCPEVPDVDLIVRTSGEQRLSGFQTWRSTYSELMFVDAHWPAMTTKDFDILLERYAQRHRRFGC